MYRDDDVARTERANALIDEIAELERKKLAQAETDQRLAAAKRELSSLHGAVAEAAGRPPGAIAHLIVFSAAAVAAFAGYTLLA
ncbi:MAG: hypothetical protein AB7P03_07215 [Kofleriaceae bacterium]